MLGSAAKSTSAPASLRCETVRRSPLGCKQCVRRHSAEQKKRTAQHSTAQHSTAHYPQAARMLEVCALIHFVRTKHVYCSQAVLGQTWLAHVHTYTHALRPQTSHHLVHGGSHPQQANVHENGGQEVKAGRDC